MAKDDALLSRPALCLEWAAPLGGLGGLARDPVEGLGTRLRRALRDPAVARKSEIAPEALAEAERLAASIARIAYPGMRVSWSETGTPPAGRALRDVSLDRRLLAPRRGWDLPHRVDALMGMTLYDAAHAARTPAGYRGDLAAAARASGLLTAPGDGGDGAEAAMESIAPLLALFLLVETVHAGAWLDAEYPGFRGYRQTLWTWRIPADEVERRLSALRGRPTFGTLLDTLTALATGRCAPGAAPPEVQPLLEIVADALVTISARSEPEERYTLALRLFALLRELFAPDQSQQPGGAPRWHGTGQDERDPIPSIEPPQERPALADEDLEGRQAALEAMAAIAGNGLNPEEVREGLSAEQLRAVEGLREGGGDRRGAGEAGADDEETAMEFVRQRRVRLPGARPMRVITPPIGPDVRVRYSGSYSMVRGQADALRQVLRFRLAERRHATRGHYSGLLDEQALYRLAGGDEGIFMRRAVESAPDQDLCILLDESASMGPGHRHARATAVLFHHALRGLPGVRHWVFGFSGYGRAIALYRYISPAHSNLQQPERLGAVRSREATPLAEAVAGAAEAMLAEGQGRERLMIVVTDGQPDDPEGARLALRAAESRGVVILGLGIAADAAAARDLFNHFTMYQDVASLPRRVGAILRRVVGSPS